MYTTVCVCVYAGSREIFNYTIRTLSLTDCVLKLGSNNGLAVVIFVIVVAKPMIYLTCSPRVYCPAFVLNGRKYTIN